MCFNDCMKNVPLEKKQRNSGGFSAGIPPNSARKIPNSTVIPPEIHQLSGGIPLEFHR